MTDIISLEETAIILSSRLRKKDFTVKQNNNWRLAEKKTKYGSITFEFDPDPPLVLNSINAHSVDLHMYYDAAFPIMKDYRHKLFPDSDEVVEFFHRKESRGVECGRGKNRGSRKGVRQTLHFSFDTDQKNFPRILSEFIVYVADYAQIHAKMYYNTLFMG